MICVDLPDYSPSLRIIKDRQSHYSYSVNANILDNGQTKSKTKTIIFWFVFAQLY